jgi:hypothetical protein
MQQQQLKIRFLELASDTQELKTTSENSVQACKQAKLLEWD